MHCIDANFEQPHHEKYDIGQVTELFYEDETGIEMKT